MPDELTISVVIPTHDRPYQLRRALTSVRDQTRLPSEIVIIDDGTWPPLDIEDWGMPVRTLRNEAPRGPAEARNQGAETARGAYIAFLDDDDRFLPTKLERCLDAARRYPRAGLIYHRGRFADQAVVSTTGTTRPLTVPVRRMLTRQPPHVSTTLVRRSVHDEVRFDVGFEAAAELDYMLRLAMAAPVVEIDEVLTVHAPVQHETHVPLSDRINARRQYREKHAALFRQDPVAEAFYWLRLGHLHRRSGHRGQAVGCFARSALTSPSYRVQAFKGSLLVALPYRLQARLVRGLAPIRQ